MPPPSIKDAASHESGGRDRRRALILDWVAQGRVKSQIELQRLLAEVGVSANQATLSRDIRDMGILKGGAGYALPGPARYDGDDVTHALLAAARAWLLDAQCAGQLVIVKTPPGGASPLAIALDRAQWSEVAGTIAGDDTIFVATATPARARACATRLLRLREQTSR